VSTAIGFPRGRRSNPANDGHRASCGEPPGRGPRRGRGVGIGAARRGGNPGPTDTFLVGATLEPGTPRLLRKSWCLRFERAHDTMTRFHRELTVQELLGITSVSAGRPLFIPFLRMRYDTPESTRSSSDQALRAMARPGLEPGTPRFQSLRPSGPGARNPWKRAVHASWLQDGEPRSLQWIPRGSGDGRPSIPCLAAGVCSGGEPEVKPS
jgi:hypothetical protein